MTVVDIHGLALGGLWRCLTPKCGRVGPFEGPTQRDVQQAGTPLRCPTCSGTLVIYDGDRTPADLPQSDSRDFGQIV